MKIFIKSYIKIIFMVCIGSFLLLQPASAPCESSNSVPPIISLLLQASYWRPLTTLPEEEAYIDNESNLILGAPGATAKGSIVIPQSDTEYTYTYSLTPQASNPLGITVSADGIITINIPSSATPQTEYPFSITVTNNQTGNIQIIPGIVFVPETVVLAQETVPSTGDSVVADAWTGVGIEIPEESKSSSTEVSIVQSQDDEGNPVITITAATPDALTGEVTIHLPDPATLEESRQPSAMVRKPLFSSGEYPLTTEWASGKAYFSLDGYRLPPSPIRGRLAWIDGTPLTIFHRTSWKLLGPVSPEDAIVDQREPVLFVHGFTPAGLGGEAGTWGKLPEYIHNLDIDGRRFLPLEFRWRTNARFQDVADDLVTAINFIVEKTGHDVHIVAHSFGGLLVRTMLQKLNSVPLDSGLVATLTTLGSPHSGIADADDTVMHGVTFPKGQDSAMHELCLQTSCYQAGENVLNLDANAKDLLQLSSTYGYIAKALASTDTSDYPLPNGLPVQVCIGLTTDRLGIGSGTDTVDAGDGLISFAGQRFHPSEQGDLIHEEEDFGGIITERILNMPDNMRPGMVTSQKGYRHSRNAFTPPYTEPAEPYADGASHHGYLAVKEWLTAFTSSSTGLNTFILNLEVKDEDDAPVAGATVKIRIGPSMLTGDGNVTGSDGKVAVEVPYYPSTTYKPIVSKPGYKTELFDRDYTTLPNTIESSFELGTVILKDDTPVNSCTLSADIVNARTGSTIQGATVKLYKEGLYLASATTDSLGKVLFSSLYPGSYSLQLSRPDYISCSVTDVPVTASNTSTRHWSLVPVGNGLTTIRLTWGENPRDLDSHLVKFNSSGSAEYHIAYWAKSNSATGDNLDRDDTTSYGPETITIQDLDASMRYVYGVHHYSGTGSITSTSQAQVVVTLSNGQQRTFYAPSSGSGSFWKVFEVVNGRVVSCSSSCICSPDTRSDDWARALVREDWLDIIMKKHPLKTPQ